jgi:hypothetical protein
VGAQRHGQFDLSRRGTDFLLRTWDAEGGGFFSSVTERSPDTPQDVWVTCGAGLAALYAGRLEVAGGVGRWLRRLRLLQPDFPRRLLTVWSPAAGLHRTYPPEDRVRFEFVPGEARDQYFFQAGIAAGFLAQLYKATGDADWLGLAQEYMRAAEAACGHHFTNYQSGKVGWAGAVLYTLTGKVVYRDLAARVGDWLVAAQGVDGSWDAGEYRDDFTAEMVVWLDEIHQALGP